MHILHGCLLALAGVTWATQFNRTIDDTYGDSVTGLKPQYLTSSVNLWNAGQNCTTCTVKPDASLAFDHSWHDNTYLAGDGPMTVSVQFTGIAVYVYCILANTVPGSVTATNLTFTLDNDEVGSYLHLPNPSTLYEYNVSVYANQSIPNGTHKLDIVTDAGSNSAVVLFDYIQYTVDDSDPTTSSSSVISQTTVTTTTPTPTSTPTSALAPFAHPALPSATNSSVVTRPKTFSVAAVVGGIIAGVVVVALGCLACILRRRRRVAFASPEMFQERQMPGSVDASPFIMRGSAPSTSGSSSYGILSRSPHASTYTATPTFLSNGSQPVQPSLTTSATYGVDSAYPHSRSRGTSEAGRYSGDSTPADIIRTSFVTLPPSLPRPLPGSSTMVAAELQARETRRALAALEAKRNTDRLAQSRFSSASRALRSPTEASVLASAPSVPPDETQNQIHSLWTEVHRLRAQQAIQEEQIATGVGETLPSYEEADRVRR